MRGGVVGKIAVVEGTDIIAERLSDSKREENVCRIENGYFALLLDPHI